MYAAIDMGGTNTRIAVFASPLTPEFTILTRFPTKAVYEDQVAAIVSATHPISDLQGIGFAIGAQLTHDGAAIDATYTMPDFVDKPLVADVTRRVSVPVVAANDNLCANLAETVYGVLAPYNRAAYLTVSTGTGAGIRIGSLNEGAFLYLAQVGHHIVYPDGQVCGCGQTGCVQTVTGGQSILQRYGIAAAQLHNEQAWQHITETLALAVVNLARITRVEAVCVGGGIGYNAPYIREHLAERVRAKAPGLSVALLFPALGEDAPITGAMMLLHTGLHKTIFH